MLCSPTSFIACESAAEKSESTLAFWSLSSSILLPAMAITAVALIVGCALGYDDDDDDADGEVEEDALPSEIVASSAEEGDSPVVG